MLIRFDHILRDAQKNELELVEETNLAVLVLSKIGQIKQVNKAAKLLLSQEYNLAVEAGSMFQMPEDLLASLESAKTETNYQCDSKVLSVDGVSKRLRWSIMWDPFQESYFCTVSDITTKFQRDQSFSKFAEVMRAELEQPIVRLRNTIASYEPRGSDNFARCDSLLQNLHASLDDFIYLQFVDRGQIVLRIQRVLVANLIKDATTLFAAKADSISIQSFVDDNTFIECDARLMRRAIFNLLSNALAHSPSGETIKIQCSLTSINMVLTIENEVVLHSQASEQEYLSSGFGLEICEAVIKAHGGELETTRRQSHDDRCTFFAVLTMPIRGG